MENRTLRVSYDSANEMWQVKDEKQIVRTVETKSEARNIGQTAYEEDPAYKELVIETKSGGMESTTKEGSSGGVLNTFKQGISNLGSDASRAASKVSESTKDNDSDDSGGMSLGFGGGMDNEGGPSLPGGMSGGMEGESDGGPTLPGFGGMGNDDQDGGPMLPDFGGGGESDGGPQFPGFGGMDGQDGGAATLPGFGMGMDQEDDDADDEDEPKPFGFKY